MGQNVTVVRKPSSNREVVRFEINRSLTGMGHERYSSPADIVRDRPVDVLARRLFDHGGIDAIHVNSSIITVDLAGGSTGEGIEDVIRNLFRYYPSSSVDAEVEGLPVDEVTEPDAAEAPESAVTDEARTEGTLADASDAPSAGEEAEPEP